MSIPSIFIGYRRSDTAGVAGRVRDRLVDLIGEQRVFFDVDQRRPGEFRDSIANAIQAARFFLVLIGPSWEHVQERDGSQRLARPDDHVRFEIETALAAKIPIIPVLVDRADMPREDLVPRELRRLFTFSGLQLRTTSFDSDMAELVRMLGLRRRRGAVAIGAVSAAVLLSAAAGAWFHFLGSDNPPVTSVATPPGPPSTTDPLHLRFDVQASKLSPESSPPEVLEYQQRAPRLILKKDGERERIARQRSGGFLFKVARSDLPLPAHTYVAKVSRPEGPPSMGLPRDTTELCFQATPGLAEVSELDLDCIETQGCVPKSAYAEPCDPVSSGWRLPGLIGTAHAAPDPRPEGWRVPSLRSLREASAETRPGYTLFEISAEPFSGFPAAHFMTLGIRINGVPIYVDGLTAHDLPIPVDPTLPTTMNLGVPNLNFRGRDYGWDDLSLRFELFDASGRHLAAHDMGLRYAPLRDLPDHRENVFGASTVISGVYEYPKSEDRFTVVVLSARVSEEPCPSTPDKNLRDRIDHAVGRIDAAELTLDGAPVVSVVRPPRWRGDLKPPRWNCAFGVALGLVEKSQQVRLSFDEETARKVCRLALQARRDGVRVIDDEPYLRDLGASRNLACQ